MILADTSVWIDYLRKTDALLASLLNTVQIVIHPFIIGELACGNLKNRNASALPRLHLSQKQAKGWRKLSGKQAQQGALYAQLI